LPNQSELYDNTHTIVVNCLILDSKRELSVIHRLDDDMEDVYAIPNRYKLMELFEEGIHQKRMYHFGVILIKVVNFDALTNIVNAHEKTAIDYLVTEKLKKLEFIYCVGKVTQDTYEIITNDFGDNADMIDYIQIIKDVLMHQSFYDNDMNVYSLDYRIGIAVAPENGFTQRELLRNASIAIAKATTEEQGYVQVYHEEIMHEVTNRLQIETRLRDSIFTNQLFLEYQPQYDVLDDQIRGFETLVRWRLQDGTVMSPNEFIPIAEESNLMDELGEWVFRNSIEQAVIWNNEYQMNWTLSVNVSVVQLEQEGYALSILEIIKEFEYDPTLLEIEVTETKMAKSSDRVFIELRKLQEVGIKIAIDDFGTGYSSLDFLRLMPFDVIKIDKGFIQRLNENEVDKKIVESIITLVKNINIHSVAEGVETAEQLNFLKKLMLILCKGLCIIGLCRQNKLLK
jgi:diguanylate cyclase